MRKFIYSLMFVMLALQGQAHAQTVIKQCPDGSTVGGNSQCPSYGGGGYRTLRPFHVAIVYSKSTKNFAFASDEEEKNWGAWGYIERKAKKYCSKSYGAKDCETVFHVKDMCYALARGEKYYATAFGRDEKQAKERALYTCQGNGDACKIVLSNCL